MPHIRIVTDSTCDIPESLLRQFDIAVAPFSVQFGRGAYGPASAGEQVPLEALVERLRGGAWAQAQIVEPAIDDLIAFYRELRDTCDGILSYIALLS